MLGLAIYYIPLLASFKADIENFLMWSSITIEFYRLIAKNKII